MDTRTYIVFQTGIDCSFIPTYLYLGSLLLYRSSRHETHLWKDKIIKAIIWDYDGTLVDTHIKNLNVTRKIIEQITGKKPEKLPPLSNLNNYRIAARKAKSWRELYKNEFALNENEI